MRAAARHLLDAIVRRVYATGKAHPQLVRAIEAYMEAIGVRDLSDSRNREE